MGRGSSTPRRAERILRRRIGRNELAAIQVALAYVQAQNEYALRDPGGLGLHAYAEHIVSSPGKEGWTLLADCRGRGAESVR